MRRVVAALAAFAALACSRTERAASREVVVVGMDYAFQAPDTLPPGLTTFRFVNRGKVRHELNISLLKEGVPVDSLIATRKQGIPAAALVESPVGVLFVEPGDSASSGLTVNLLPGRQYAIICILRDTDDAKRHFEMGMYTVVTAASGTPDLRPEIGADTVVATDHAFTYPRTLGPGRHDFVFRNDGKVQHQVSMVLLKRGETVAHLIEVGNAGGDVDALIEQDLGLLHAAAGVTPVGRLTVDLLPGREYGLACFVQDSANAPPHVALGMYGSIRTSAPPSS